MTAKTKAQLEIENEALRGAASFRTMIKNCQFTGSATDAQCRAVEQIAVALQYAAQALKGAPSIYVGAAEDKSSDD